MELEGGQNILPTIVPVSKNFTPGKGIKIQCVVPSGTSRFNVGLHCGHNITLDDDVALQISFNLLNNIATVNSRQKELWSDEHSIPGFPFKRGEKLQLVLICQSSVYEVYINGQRYCEFPQNIDYQHITYLTINGDIVVEQVSYEAEPLPPTSHGFGGSDIPLSIYDIETQSKNDATIPLNSNISNLHPMPRSRVKQYVGFSALVLLIIIIILCAVFIPLSRKNNEPYDFD